MAISLENLSDVEIEKEIRELYGDKIIDDLLNCMDFKELVVWLEEPNKWFDNKTPLSSINFNGAQHMEEMIENHKWNNYA